MKIVGIMIILRGAIHEMPVLIAIGQTPEIGGLRESLRISGKELTRADARILGMTEEEDLIQETLQVAPVDANKALPQVADDQWIVKWRVQALLSTQTLTFRNIATIARNAVVKFRTMGDSMTLQGTPITLARFTDSTMLGDAKHALKLTG